LSEKRGNYSFKQWRSEKTILCYELQSCRTSHRPWSSGIIHRFTEDFNTLH
jgi:hypothetical protein